jgi:hypothetical protein
LTKPRTVALPDYPPSLLEPTDYSRGEVFEQLLDLLGEHYRLSGRFSDLPDPKPNDPLPGKELDLWMGLAWGLIRDFVPAFGKRKSGRPRKSYTGFQFHGARLVQIVRAVRQMLKEKGLPSTRLDTFAEVIRILKKKPAPRWEFGSLTKPSSFMQEWKTLPGHIKKDPDFYIPIHSSSHTSPLRKFAMRDPAMQRYLELVVLRDLPPIPTKLVTQ